MVNVAAFYDGPDDRPCARRGSADFAAALRQGDAGAYVNFLGDEGEARVRAGLPGPDLGPAGGDQGSLRPDQPLPPQPEHPAGHPDRLNRRPGGGPMDPLHADGKSYVMEIDEYTQGTTSGGDSTRSAPRASSTSATSASRGSSPTCGSR